MCGGCTNDLLCGVRRCAESAASHCRRMRRCVLLHRTGQHSSSQRGSANERFLVLNGYDLRLIVDSCCILPASSPVFTCCIATIIRLQAPAHSPHVCLCLHAMQPHCHLDNTSHAPTDSNNTPTLTLVHLSHNDCNCHSSARRATTQQA